MKSLLTPGICLLALAILLHTGLLAPGGMLIAYIFYGTWIAGVLLAWRFHSSRILFSLLVLCISQQAISYFSAGRAAAHGPGSIALAAIGVLLPLDFVLCSLAKEKGFTFSTVAPAAVLLFFESVIVAVLCRPKPTTAGAHPHHVLAAPLPWAALLVFAAAGVVLLARFRLYRKPVESGLFWAMTACLLALRFGGVGRIPETYFAAAAFILAGTIVESSYLLAYQDELTGLPSRRAFHESLLRLENIFSIAMVDIDHFKRCNDTYGHDTGDQVLRLVAGRLARVSGGGRAYRCGGEEFAVVFPGKTTSEVLPHLEDLRASIESSSFRLRGPERRHEPRASDRRDARPRTRTRGKTRELAQASAATELSVTASIGVATSSQKNSTPEEVIKAADKALYRAKNGGRNRVETDSAKPRKTRSKTAGIA